MMNYSLTVRNVKNQEQFKKLYDSLEEFDLQKYVFDTGAYYQEHKEAVFCSWEPQEWRSRKGQMTVLSEKYPKMVFQLTLQEQDAFWREYYKNGFTEQCIGEVTFEKPKKIDWDALSIF